METIRGYVRLLASTIGWRQSEAGRPGLSGGAGLTPDESFQEVQLKSSIFFYCFKVFLLELGDLFIDLFRQYSGMCH